MHSLKWMGSLFAAREAVASTIAWRVSICAQHALVALVIGCVAGCSTDATPSPTGTSNTTGINIVSAPPLPPEDDLPIAGFDDESPVEQDKSIETEPAEMKSTSDQPRSKTTESPDADPSDADRVGLGKKDAGRKPASPPARARPPVRRVGSDGITDITFDDLKLDMPIGTLFDRTMLTPRVRELDGKIVRLRGFIFAGGVFQSTDIKSFPFVMNTQCKFGPQGLAYCVILVELEDGVKTDFTTYPITVEGKLSLRPFNASGFTWSVYHMRGKKVF